MGGVTTCINNLYPYRY